MSLHQNNNVKEPNFSTPVARVTGLSIREARNRQSHEGRVRRGETPYMSEIFARQQLFENLLAEVSGEWRTTRKPAASYGSSDKG
jgi:hypothetical protein